LTFLLGSIAQCPDIMLDELQECLEHQQGKQVSISTLEQTLKRVGYTLKKV
ncbi:hypothetical protein M407DRAFT_47416, partial [Tulasnella calospora MUT 4182]